MEMKEIVSDIARFEIGLRGIITKMQAMNVATQETSMSVARQGRELNSLKLKNERLAMSESSILKSILDYLQIMRNQGKCWYVRVGSGVIQTASGHYFKTGAVGCPDILVLTRQGLIALEVKAEKGKLSEGQVGVKNEIELLGGRYHVVRSVDDVIEALLGGIVNVYSIQ